MDAGDSPAVFELVLGWLMARDISVGLAVALFAFFGVWCVAMLALWSAGLSAKHAVLIGMALGTVAAILAPRLLSPALRSRR